MANIDPDSKQSILSLLGIPAGTLPVKFLGVPLISSKLSYNDCIPLIHRITKKVTSWTSKVLAYSGRLQLIKSVLFSIQAFWSSHFLLPKAVIRAIQSILSRFLWKGPTLARYGAKVAWSSLSLPINEGGLGIKSLLDWNKSLMLIQLTKVLQFKPSSLWANWAKVTVLKKRNIWQIDIPNDCSWIWRQILKLRSVALEHITYKVGKGENISLWFDPWLNRSPLFPSNNLILNSGIPLHATVSDILHNSTWKLPHSNHHEVIMMRRQIESIPPPPTCDDCILWNSLDITTIKAKNIWECIRNRKPEVGWHKVLWHKLHIPRFSFSLWLGFQKRLPTNDITKHYGSGIEIMCPLCQHYYESYDHLFFSCDYSSVIVRTAFSIGKWDNIPMDWYGLTDFVINFQGTTLTKNILYLSLATAFYKTWEARNIKIHQDTLIPVSTLAKEVVNLIKSRLSTSKAFLKATNFCNYYCNWIL